MIHWLRLKLSRKNMRWLYDHVYYSWWISGGRRFFNAGIAPVDEEVRQFPFVRGDEDQAQVYYEILKTYRKVAARAAPRRILELGVGLGGGISLIHAFCPVSQYFGLDISLAALRRARDHPNDGLVVANLLRAPYKAGIFDLIFGVEASPGVPWQQLFAEPRRMLAPDGLLILADTWEFRAQALQDALRDAAGEAGFELALFVDLTSRLLEARKVDVARNRRLDRWPVPGIRRAVREMSAAAGSTRHARYLRGELTHFIAAFAPVPR